MPLTSGSQQVVIWALLAKQYALSFIYDPPGVGPLKCVSGVPNSIMIREVVALSKVSPIFNWSAPSAIWLLLQTISMYLYRILNANNLAFNIWQQTKDTIGEIKEVLLRKSYLIYYYLYHKYRKLLCSCILDILRGGIGGGGPTSAVGWMLVASHAALIPVIMTDRRRSTVTMSRHVKTKTK